jgi:hypothetical protein
MDYEEIKGSAVAWSIEFEVIAMKAVLSMESV